MSISPCRISILHLFTTGPSLKYDDCFQFEIRTFSTEMKSIITNSWLFSVSRPIGELLNRETGISTSELNGKPDFKSTLPEILELLSTSDYLFYFGNEKETGFLRAQLPPELFAKTLNLKLVAQVLFPYLEKFTLRHVNKLTGQPHSHPRLDMTSSLDILIQFLKTCYLKYQSDDKVRFFISHAKSINSVDPLLFFFSKLIPNFDQFSGFQIQQPDLLLAVPDKRPAIELHLKSILKLRSIPLNISAEVADIHSFKPINPTNIRDYFESGKLGKTEGGFDRREQQVDYALKITETINNRSGLLIEAGTGTGKTLGYLLPAMEFLRLNPGKRLIISTAMKNLQHQIFGKEIHRVRQFFPAAFKEVQVSVLKGKSNYVCLGHLKRKLIQHWDEDLFQFARDDYFISLYLVHLASYRHAADLESIPQEVYQRFPELSEFLEQVRADIVCFKGSCDYAGNCVYDQSVKEAERSHLVIVNHAKFFNMPQFLMDTCHAVIIDEADLFPAYFKGSLSVEINAWEVRKLLSNALGKRGKPGWRSQVKMLGSEAKLLDVDEMLRRIDNGLSGVTRKLQNLAKNKPGFYLPDSSEISSEYELKQLFNELSEPVQGLNQLMQDLKESEGFHVPERAQSLFSVFSFRLENIAASFSLFSRDYLSKTYCHFASVRDTDWVVGKRAVYLHERFKEWVEEHSPCWIFTSATMTLDKEFDFFTKELGLQAGDYEEVTIPSPFNYPEQAGLMIASWIPAYNHNDYRARIIWNEEVVKTCGYLSAAANGRTLILCTSYDQMDSIYREIADPLESAGIMVFKQEGASVDIMNQFAENEHSVLIGVDRMWTGVDFPGSTLSQVIIVKLPFVPADDPEMKHRQVVEGQSFWNYYNGVAKLKFRQGVGRLIRTRKDLGVVVVLDSRIMTGKNQQFLLNIPDMPVYRFKTLAEAGDYMLRKTHLQQEFRRRIEVIEPIIKKFAPETLSL
ncbi:MAG: hypothetical protein J0L62_06380 [Bacteroidetes bacterium]|nr:hypothetical protein [Bacteroidota bacterium]